MGNEGRLAGKAALVVGAGQTPGDTVGNGRATALLFAREGARVMLADRDIESAQETERMILSEGGKANSVRCDVMSEADCQAAIQSTVDAYGRLDILHNNVGIGTGDGYADSVSEEVWDRILDVNLRGMFFTCKHALGIMRKQQSGSIVNVSSAAAVAAAPMLTAYKTSKAGVNAFTQAVAMGNAKYGIRANVVMPGLINTPMAIEGHAKARGIPKEDLIRERDKRVPLKGGMGSAWDVAYAALFLASDEAKFITGVVLPVDGGQVATIG